MKAHGDHLLAAAPVPKAFFKLAVPAVAAQLINILYNLVDKMFIGHIPEVGKQALAGVGVTTPVILAISAFAALVSMGGAPKASIFLGKGENEQAERVIGSCTGNRYRARRIHLFCHSLSLHRQKRSAATTAEYPL